MHIVLISKKASESYRIDLHKIFVISAVLRLPPHNFHPTVGSRHHSGPRGEQGKMKRVVLLYPASTKVSWRIKPHVSVQVKDWLKDKLTEITPIENQEANVIKDMEMLQREVYI